MNYLNNYINISRHIQKKCIKGQTLTLKDRVFVYWHGTNVENVIDYSEDTLHRIFEKNEAQLYPGCIYVAADKSRHSSALKNALVYYILEHPEYDIIESKLWNDIDSWVMEGLNKKTVLYAFKHAPPEKNGFLEPCVLLPHLDGLSEYHRTLFFENEPEKILSYLEYILKNHVHIEHLSIIIHASPKVLSEKIKTLMLFHMSEYAHYDMWFDNLEYILHHEYDKDIFSAFHSYHKTLQYTCFPASISLIQDPYLKTVTLGVDIDIGTVLYAASEHYNINDWYPDNLDILAFKCYFDQYPCPYDNHSTFEIFKNEWEKRHSLLSYDDCYKLLSISTQMQFNLTEDQIWI